MCFQVKTFKTLKLRRKVEYLESAKIYEGNNFDVGSGKLWSRQYLEKAILCEGNKSDGDSGDEAACDWDEAADEDEHRKQPQTWQFERPNSKGS